MILRSSLLRGDLRYLRYSDDIFFYGPQDYRYTIFRNHVRRIIVGHSFHMNVKKTLYHPVGRPRFTLGLSTHGKKPQLPRASKRGYRAAFFKASRNLKWARDNLDRLAGMAEWHRAIYGQDEIFLEYKKIIENVRHVKLHQQYVT